MEGFDHVQNITGPFIWSERPNFIAYSEINFVACYGNDDNDEKDDDTDNDGDDLDDDDDNSDDDDDVGDRHNNNDHENDNYNIDGDNDAIVCPSGTFSLSSSKPDLLTTISTFCQSQLILCLHRD